MNCTKCGHRAYSELCVKCKPRKAIITNVQPKKQIECLYCGKYWHQSERCLYKPWDTPKPCEFCKATTHFSWQCLQNPKRTEQIRAKIKAGRISMKWKKTRVGWHKKNKSATHTCHYCGKTMTKDETTLDHKIPRSRAPELRFDFTNLVPCCFTCNGLKGSIDHDHYKHNCPDGKIKETA